MTVTVTAEPKDVAGQQDNDPWEFAAVPHGAGTLVVTDGVVEITPTDGAFTIDLEPGPVIAIHHGRSYNITVPNVAANLGDLIAASLPSGTTVDVLAAAIAAYLTVHPVGGLAAVQDDPAPELGGNLNPNGHNIGVLTPADLAKLHAAGALSGSNTGDQDLSGLVPGTRNVNGHSLSADVTLTQDDVASGVTNKVYTATEKAKLAAQSGTNTGDQDLSSFVTSSAMATAITNAVNGILNGAPGALDTLKELADAIGDDANYAASVATALAARVPATRTVNGHALTADVTVTKSDIGLPLADNTSDATKLAAAVAAITGTAAASASTLAARDASANLSADAFIPGSTSTVTSATPVILTVDSTEVQIFTGNTAQTVQLPTTGIVAGQQFQFVYPGLNVLTVQSSGGNTIAQLSALVNATFVALVNTPTTAAHWAYMAAPSAGFGASVSNNTIAQRSGQGNIQANNFLPNITATVTSGGTSGMTNSSANTQLFTGATTHALTLPTTGVAAGWAYKIINTSTGAITINASGGALVKTLAAGAQTEVTALIATPTTAAHWFAT